MAQSQAFKDKNLGTVPSFFPFKIGWSAPRASCLILRLGDLRVFAVNLGRLLIARHKRNGYPQLDSITSQASSSESPWAIFSASCLQARAVLGFAIKFRRVIASRSPSNRFGNTESPTPRLQTRWALSIWSKPIGLCEFAKVSGGDERHAMSALLEFAPQPDKGVYVPGTPYGADQIMGHGLAVAIAER